MTRKVVCDGFIRYYEMPDSIFAILKHLYAVALEVYMSQGAWPESRVSLQGREYMVSPSGYHVRVDGRDWRISD